MIVLMPLGTREHTLAAEPEYSTLKTGLFAASIGA